ncbi:MAG: hypothetical protein JNL74_15750 [Fibrobacteres bacterium]|nr:hypothetical protein [Fibrobacterota bacterium]
MDDVYSTRSRHGHYAGKAIWWMDHAVVDGKPMTFMVMVGERIIGDKACYRIGNGQEVFFEPFTVQRDDIIIQGKDLIKAALSGKKVTAKNGAPYDWLTAEPSD